MNIKYTSAFTVIELMTVITIMAIVVTVAAPSMTALIEKNRLETSTMDFMRSIASARSEAISRNSDVVLCRSTNATSCSEGGWEDGWISFGDTDGDDVLDGGENVISVFSTEDTLTIRSDATNPNLISFSADGSISEIVTFRICGADGDTDDAKSVAISATGRPRYSSGATQCP